MRFCKLFSVLLFGAAILQSSVAAADLIVMSPSTTLDPIPGNNDFAGDFQGMGLDRIVQGDIKTAFPGVLRFFAHGAESGFDNTFSSPAGSFTETSNFGFDSSGIYIGSLDVGSGVTLASLGVQFTSNLGVPAALGQQRFGVFVNSSKGSGPYDVLFLGYDDSGAGPDDDYDDLVISVQFVRTPEPMSLLVWAAVAGGFAYSQRRRLGLAG